MREFLTRRIGPFPMWLYFIVFVIGLAVFLRWRQTRNGGSAMNSNAADAPNLTNQPSTLIPWTNDVFVNVHQSPIPGPAGPPGPPGSPGTYMPGTIFAPVKTIPLPSMPWPSPRVMSITYAVKSGDTLARIAAANKTTVSAVYAANKSTIEAAARQHGFSSSNGGSRIWPTTTLVIPG